MPTRFALLSLLATLAPVGAWGDERASLTPDGFARIRPGVTSSGPARLPRRRDTLVEPVTFQSYGTERPLPLSNTTPRETSEDPPQAPATDQAPEPPSPTRPPPETAEPAPFPPSPPERDGDHRRLGGGDSEPEARASRSGRYKNPFASLLAWRPSTQTLTATGAGLAIAVGLLLSFVWLIRCCAPKSSRPLPREVVEVLGRTPLGAKQTTQLVRVGNKLVLVAITPEGAEALTEVTDPDEVARLIAACDAGAGKGSHAEFDSLLRQMEDQRTTPGFLDTGDERRDSLGFADGSFDPRSLAAAYANTPGGRGDG